MNRQQFRVLYREFLFRMVDLELLSVQGDMNKLLGQFAAFLLLLAPAGHARRGSDGLESNAAHDDAVIRPSRPIWSTEHFLIAIRCWWSACSPY